ncbi:MAG: GNAT family N-acetyltransferase [Armatimonadetes bacterium]|nr:GNAT family N-acetyltransferase [Armatimonadota bacterium]
MRVPPVTVRLASASDQARVDEIMLAASMTNINDREWVLANRDMVYVPSDQIADGQVVVATESGVVTGFAVLVPLDSSSFELDGLFVHPDQMRRGVGRALVEHVCHVARCLGGMELLVTGNQAATDFFLKCGFFETGKAQTLGGPAVRLVRHL